MGWIKVTPETMPPHMERVLVTIFDTKLQRRFTIGDAWYDKAENGWFIRTYEKPNSDGCSIAYAIQIVNVTHWMPLPPPAED